MKYIPLKDANKDKLKDWIAKANVILDALKKESDPKKRKVIIRQNRSHWRDKRLLDFLKQLSNGKCWYSEAKFTADYPHLEHFRPKSCARNEAWKKCHDGYWWLAFDIENYRLSKPLPNTRKGSYFPLRERAQAVCNPGIAISREAPMFLDPTDPEDVELVSFNALGKPEPCPNPPVDLDEWDKKRIEFSIKRFALDDQDLCNERKELWVSLTAQFNEYADNLTRFKDEACIESKGKATQIAARLEAYLYDSQPFTSLIKACFDAHPVGQILFRRFASFPAAA